MKSVAVLLLFSGLWTGGAEQGQEARFFRALGQVESGCNPNAVGDGGRAIGQYQLWMVYVDDVNRIIGKKEFAYGDRYCPAKSRRMVLSYLRHYAVHRRLGRPVTVLDMAAIHCSGPNGYKKRFTSPGVKAYVAKFMDAYRKAEK